MTTINFLAAKNHISSALLSHGGGGGRPCPNPPGGGPRRHIALIHYSPVPPDDVRKLPRRHMIMPPPLRIPLHIKIIQRRPPAHPSPSPRHFHKAHRSETRQTPTRSPANAPSPHPPTANSRRSDTCDSDTVPSGAGCPQHRSIIFVASSFPASNGLKNTTPFIATPDRPHRQRMIRIRSVIVT